MADKYDALLNERHMDTQEHIATQELYIARLEKEVKQLEEEVKQLRSWCTGWRQKYTAQRRDIERLEKELKAAQAWQAGRVKMIYRVRFDSFAEGNQGYGYFTSKAEAEKAARQWVKGDPDDRLASIVDSAPTPKTKAELVGLFCKWAAHNDNG